MGKVIGAAVLALLLGLGGGALYGKRGEEAARDEARAQREQLEKALADARADAQTARAEASSQKDRADKADAHGRESDAALASTRTKAVADADAAAKKAQELMGEVTSLQSNLAGVQAQAKTQLDLVKGRLDAAQQDAKKLHDQLTDQAMKAGDQAKAELTRLKALADERGKQLDNLHAQVAELTGYKDKYAQAQQESAAWKGKADQANARVAQLEQSVKDLTTQVAELKTQLANATSLFGGGKK